MNRKILAFKPATGRREPRTRRRKPAKVLPMPEQPTPPILKGDAIAEIVKMLYRVNESKVKDVWLTLHTALREGKPTG